jgi:hypothetical protein
MSLMECTGHEDFEFAACKYRRVVVGVEIGLAQEASCFRKMVNGLGRLTVVE